MRELPVQSALHRLWAGTKLVCLLLLVAVVLFFPGWPAALLGTAVVFSAACVARVPFSAVPRFPKWFWLLLLAGAGLSFLGGGIALYLESLLITLVLVGAAAIVGWTTPVANIPPAVAVLGAPLRLLRLPVDEWALTMALCVRTLPSLVDELRILLAARRLRPRPARPGTIGSLVVCLATELVDLLTSIMAVTTRRGAEVGRAITARGGIPALGTERPKLGLADALTVVIVVTAATLIVRLTL
jgi:energy-coupling factor transport system permease protein